MRPARALVTIALTAAVAAAPACLTLDSFFFSPEVVDGYDWDADPPDPDLEGELTDAHPSVVGPEDRHEGFIELDDRRVHYVFAHREGADTTIFYSHGNTQHLGRYWDRVERMWALGYHVMIYDYPGFGLSTGTPDEPGMYENAAEVLALLEDMPDTDPERVFFFGYSIGATATTELAVRAQNGEIGIAPRGVVTEAAFCSAEALVQDGTFLNFKDDFLTNHVFDNCGNMQTLDDSLPRLIIHGGDDDFVVPRQAELLAAAAGDAGRLEMFEGAVHSDIPLIDGARYDTLLVEFFTLP